jgi:tetratricopeptide (TPR) repeat protein
MVGAAVAIPMLKPSILAHARARAERKESRWRSAYDEGVSALNSGDYARAEEALSEAAALGRELHRAHQAIGELALGLLDRKRGQFEQARRRFLNSLELRMGDPFPDAEAVSRSLNRVADVSLEMGDVGGAIEFGLRALDFQEKRLGKDHPELVPTLFNLAGAYEQKALLSEASVVRQRITAIETKELEEKLGKVGTSYHLLARNYQVLSEPALADAAYARAVETLAKRTAKHDERLEYLIRDYASFLRSSGREAEAVEIEALIVTEP